MLFFGLNVASVSSAEERPPNIILLLADDLGWTGMKCFGSDFYQTPNLDALAKDGLRFTNAYAACTVCSPTRASVMTGLYPARMRLTDFIAGQNRPFAKMRIPKWTKQLELKHGTLPQKLKHRVTGRFTLVNGTCLRVAVDRSNSNRSLEDSTSTKVNLRKVEVTFSRQTFPGEVNQRATM